MNTAPYHLFRWASLISRTCVLGTCLWFCVGTLLWIIGSPILLATLAGLTSLQVVVAIAETAVLSHLRKWPGTPYRKHFIALGIGLLPIVIATLTIVTGWVLLLKGR